MKICILGKDKRNLYLKEMYHEKLENIINADMIVTPIPITKDGEHITDEIITIDNLVEYAKEKKKIIVTGGLSQEIKEKLEQITYYNIMSFEDIAIYNAIPTVEGAIKCAIENTETTLNGMNICILGYGKIGKILAKYLSSFGANLYCEARKETDIAFIEAMGYHSIQLEKLEEYIPRMDIIFNTIPFRIIDKELLELVSNDAIIIDLASRPGGVDFEEASKQNKKVFWELGIPSKVAPKSAAKYLKKAIDKLIDENERKEYHG